jgi:glycosyltransferase involved in cell wall biosynthesis
MRVMSRRIECALGAEGLRPDLIHAHKLTFEGIAACELSQALGVPYCVTVRGFTDHKVIRAKPGLRRLYRRILADAAGVFFVAPWSRRILERQLETDLSDAVMLPNVCPVLRGTPGSAEAPVRRFVSVFHFKRHRGKNLANVLRALRLLQNDGPDVGIDLIGGATEAEVAEVNELARRHGVAQRVRALRTMDQDTLQRTLPNYIAMVLPSYPETFGLVYVEALAAGLPVIFARDAGIDGYIDDLHVARAVDHRDPADIAAAMRDFLRDPDAGHAAVRAFRAAGGLEIFEAARVGAVYREAVARMTARDTLATRPHDRGAVPALGWTWLRRQSAGHSVVGSSCLRGQKQVWAGSSFASQTTPTRTRMRAGCAPGVPVGCGSSSKKRMRPGAAAGSSMWGAPRPTGRHSTSSGCGVWACPSRC